jgi:hypothetical protein
MVAVPVLSAFLLKAVFEKPLWHRLIPAMRGRLPRKQEESVPPRAVSPNFPVDAAPWRMATGTHPFGFLYKHEKGEKR